MKNFWQKTMKVISRIAQWRSKNRETREFSTLPARDMGIGIKTAINETTAPGVFQESQTESAQSDAQPRLGIGESRAAESCPYCNSKNFVKRGVRKNRHQSVQLYLCKNLPDCGRTFTAQDVKGKHFPLNVVIEAMSYYNLGFNLEESCAIVGKKFGRPAADIAHSVEGNSQKSRADFIPPTPATVSAWIEEYKDLCRYERLRPYAVKMCKPKDTVEVVTMAHRQLYRFRYHRPKTVLMLEEFKNRNLRRLKDYLDAVSSETPHQYFQDGERMSDVRSKFDTADMIVKSKSNYANRLAAFVLQTVSENKARHEAVQRFFLANDSVTVATEVPVYIRKEDIEHMENVLHFKVLGEGGLVFKGDKEKSPRRDRLNAEATSARGRQEEQLPRLLTGHIDLVQIRNGQVHILDYKPGAAKERPIEQLTWYALALSRLTGLRLFEFTCAWFDEKDYYQFFPLHVVKKLRVPLPKLKGRLTASPKSPRKRIVRFKDGTIAEVPRVSLPKVTIVPRVPNAPTGTAQRGKQPRHGDGVAPEKVAIV